MAAMAGELTALVARSSILRCVMSCSHQIRIAEINKLLSALNWFFFFFGSIGCVSWCDESALLECRVSVSPMPIVAHS